MKYYIVGIKGVFLSSLAVILKDLGFEVAGYDDNIEYRFTEDILNRKNIPIYTDENNYMELGTVVVRSEHVSLEHSEIRKALDMGLRVYEYNEIVSRLTKLFDTITVAGCYGKSYVASLLAHTLSTEETPCNYLIGNGEGFASKMSREFVVETSEFKKHFCDYTMEYAIITNIDINHVDYFHNIDEIMEAYTEYANKASKMVFANGDDEHIRKLNVNAPIFYYGINENNEIRALNIDYYDRGTSFDVFIEDNYYGHFDLPIYGPDMLRDTLAVIGFCYYKRLEAKDIQKLLKYYDGCYRVFDDRKIGKTIVVDDYVHHPKQLEKIITSVRQKYPKLKIYVVFEPHSYDWFIIFKDELIKILKTVDKVYVREIKSLYENKEDYADVSSKELVSKIKNAEMIEDDATVLLKHKGECIIFASKIEMTELKHNLFKKIIK